MHILLERITNNVGIDETTASRAVSIVLNFLKTETPPDVAARIAAAIPNDLDGSEEVAPAEPGLVGSIGGLLGGLMGGGMGGMMATFTLLSDAGLDMDQVQGVTREVIAFSREQAGDELVDEVLGSIPGLARFTS